ncbi:MAG TPA: guanylate kinase [Xanthobacteraceae bacterium]|nr:guanylate kinase [Xanthobacteraceae bacterium]
MSTRPGQLVIVSGPSGAGKTTLLQRVFRDSELPLVGSVSATTRKPRPGERDGVDYHFLSPEEFARRRQQGDFLESCEVFGQGDWYGTLRDEVTPSLAAGKWVVLEIDVQGTREVLRHYPAALTIFVEPGSLDELERRLRDRGTENPAALERRLQVARREIQSIDIYRYRVVNDEIDRATRAICEILNQASLQQVGDVSE